MSRPTRPSFTAFRRIKGCFVLGREAIFGYVTRGKGVAVHGKNCANGAKLMAEEGRRISVEWKRETDEVVGDYPAKLAIHCDDRAGMLTIISGVISDSKSNIRNVAAHTSNSEATIDLEINVKNVKQLDGIVKGLRGIAGVHDVQRLSRI